MILSQHCASLLIILSLIHVNYYQVSSWPVRDHVEGVDSNERFLFRPKPNPLQWPAKPKPKPRTTTTTTTTTSTTTTSTTTTTTSTTTTTRKPIVIDIPIGELLSRDPLRLSCGQHRRPSLMPTGLWNGKFPFLAQLRRANNQTSTGTGQSTVSQCTGSFVYPSIVITSGGCLRKLLATNASSGPLANLALAYGHRYLNQGWLIKADPKSWTLNRTKMSGQDGRLATVSVYNVAKDNMTILARFEGARNINPVCMDVKNQLYSIANDHLMAYYDDRGHMVELEMALVSCPMVVKHPALCAKPLIGEDMFSDENGLPAAVQARLRPPLGSPLVRLQPNNNTWIMAGLLDEPVDINGDPMDWTDIYPNMFYFVRPQ